MKGQKCLSVLVLGAFLIVCLGCGKDKEQREKEVEADELSMEKEIFGKDGAPMVLIRCAGL